MVELLSVGNDISKVRKRLSPNFEILQRPETQKKIDEYFTKSIEDELRNEPRTNWLQNFMERLSWGLACFSLKTTFINISERIARRPFRVSCIDVCIIELLYILKNDDHLGLDTYLQKLFYRRFIAKLPDIYHQGFNTSLGNKTPASFLRKTYAEEEETDPDYPLFFTYTLRQTSVYDIDAFLSYREKFYSGDFRWFLKNVLLDDEERNLIAPRQKKVCEEWLDRPESISREKHRLLPEKPIPGNWVIVEGKLKKEQFYQFISFLYLEKDGPNGNSLLTKEETERLVRYGFAYPKTPKPGNKLTLNAGRGIPLWFVYYMFYELYQAHKRISAPQDYKDHFARFLKHHFNNFEHLTINNLKNSLRNYEQINSRRKGFDITPYLPMNTRKEGR